MEDCKPMTDNNVTIGILFVQNFVTLTVLVLWIKALFKTVEIAHPMYGVLYQDTIVLAFFIFLKILILMVIIVAEQDKKSMLNGIYIATDIAALQFHQITCLTVACLRYYLLYIAKLGDDIDMPHITKISFVAVWIAEIILIPLCQVPWIISMYAHGWPAKTVPEIAQDNEGYVIRLLFMTSFISNFPDYLSVLLYIRMYTLARKSVEPEDIPPQPQQPYGGIWVGDNEPPVVIEVPIENVQNHTQQHDKMKSILKMLRWNVMLCLVDLGSGVVWDQLVCKGTVAITAGYTFQALVCFWIPMFVLVSNFKKFGSSWSFNRSNMIQILC